MDNRNNYVSLVNKRGRVVWARPWEVDNLRAQGCKLIQNPREEYYPQYDQSLPSATDIKDNLLENVEPNDILEGDEV